MVTPFKICFVWFALPMVFDHTPPLTYKNFYCQPQKQIREMCWDKFDNLGWIVSLIL